MLQGTKNHKQREKTILEIMSKPNRAYLRITPCPKISTQVAVILLPIAQSSPKISAFSRILLLSTSPTAHL
jgi:hypothetical protein